MNRTERENREKLFKLMQENPDLPVVAMVDAEIVAGDDFGRWMGCWGSVKIDEYLMSTNYDDPMMFKSDDDVFDVLERCLPRSEFEKLPDTEEERLPLLRNIWNENFVRK